MSELRTETVTKIFETYPADTATWLVCFEALAAIHRVVKGTKTTDSPGERAARRVISSLGNGNFSTVRDYVRRPDIYPPDMDIYAQKLGARSVRGNLDPALMAVLTYRTNKSIKAAIDHHIPAFEMYANAQNFQGYFVEIASDRVDSETYPSLVDLTLAVKNDTEFWIDKELTAI